MTGTRKIAAPSIIRSAGSDKFGITISTPARDRQGDTIDPLGVLYKGYVRNGAPVQWCHDYRSLPIATLDRVWADESGLYGDGRWATHQHAGDVRGAVEHLGGRIGSSIGLIALEMQPTATGVHISKSEMIEVSLTPVPANSECMAVLRSKGLLAGWDDDLYLELADAEDLVLEIDGDLGQLLASERRSRSDLIDVDPHVLAQTVADCIHQSLSRRLNVLAGRLD